MQIIETQAFSIEEVARMFNIAPHKIKALQQSTNNNIEQQTLDHASDTIQPFITNIEQECKSYSLQLI
jgi:phage portal protein BeeE